MKLIAILLTGVFLQASATGTAQEVNLSLKNTSLQKVFREIHRQTGYQFFYEDALLDKAGKIDVEVRHASIEEVLRICFRNLPLRFEVVNRLIVVSAKPVTVLDETPAPALPPPITVRGIVRNEKGDLLAGISIVVKGSSKGTVTNENGIFILEGIDENAILVFSGVGLETQEIPVRGRISLLVSLETRVSPLDEVQIIGYGKTTQRLKTGSVGTVKADVIERQPVTNPIQAIQGRVAGVSITQTSGAIGSGIEIQVRGLGTIATGANQPLIIVDGAILPDPHNGLGSAIGSYMSFGSTSLNVLNPADIESIDILKDADATAIYGSRGANGVVLITTKKGKVGPTRVSADVSTWVNSPTYLPDYLNLSAYRQLRKDAFAMGNHNPTTGVAINPIIPTVNNAPDLFVWDSTRATTDWQQFEFGSQIPGINAQLNVSGGERRLNFYASGGYFKQRDITRGSPFQERISGNLGLNHTSSNDRLRASLNASYVFNKLKPSRGGGNGGSLQGMPPNMPLTNADGSVWWPAGTITQNSLLVAPLTSEEAFTTNQVYSFTTNLDVSYRILKGLSAKVLLGHNNQRGTTYRATPSSAINPLNPGSAVPSSTTSFSNFTSFNFEPQLTYNGNLFKGKLDLLLGSTFFDRSRESFQLTLDGFSNDLLLQSWAAASSVGSRTNSDVNYRFNSVFGRANYNWQNKYIANLTYRRDGSSRFGPKNQYGNFWAIGGAWLFSNEEWMKKGLIPGLSFGKLRASYGKTGNDNIPDYRYISTYGSTLYNGTPGLAASVLADSAVRWETSKKLDVALELGFLKDRFIIKANWFRNLSSDLLITQNLPSQTGFQSYVTNLPAIVENKGWEFELNTRNLSPKSRLQWSSTFNLSLIKNRLTEFPGLANSSFSDRLKIGLPINNARYPLNAEWTWNFEGVNPANGLPIFTDVNKDGVINNLDRTYIGSTIPRAYGGLGNTLTFKGLELDFLFQFSRQQVTNWLFNYLHPGQLQNTLFHVYNNYWKQPGDVTQFPRLWAGTATNTTTNLLRDNFPLSSAALADILYIRLKNLSLSYSLPAEWLSKLKVNKAVAYIRGQNVFTWTSDEIYKDPETISLRGGGIMLRTWTFGLQFTF